jgi:hypothetical protein
LVIEDIEELPLGVKGHAGIFRGPS